MHLAGQSGLFGAGEPEALRLTHYENWSAEERLRREFEAIGFFISGHPLDAYQKVLERLKVMSWAPFVRSVKQGAVGRPPRRDRARPRRAAHQIGQQDGNRRPCPIPSGQYEAILFQEGLNQYRDLLEKGACVLVTLQANLEGEDVRARITMVEKLDEAAARIQKGLRIILRDVAPLPKLSEKLKGKPEGDVTLVLRLDAPEREVEIKLPGRYPINPQASSAIKAIPGVAEVELV